MQYKNLGRTGLKVSRFTIGTMNYGDPVSEVDSIKIIKSVLDHGVNFIDTADGYGDGRSEEIVGKAIKDVRQSVVLATKGGVIVGPRPNDSGLSRYHIMQAIENSLKRLQTDYIDLYYAHFPDLETPYEETLRAMDDLLHQGKVRYIGCSNYPAWMISRTLGISDKYNLARFECSQSVYNLLARDIETELLPLCDSEGLGVCVYNPLAGEMLTGKHQFGKPPLEGRFTHERLGAGYLKRYWSEMNFNAVERLSKLAKEHGCTMAQFALAWILSNETITSILSGMTLLEQVEENLKALEIKLSQEDLDICNEVWQMFRPERAAYVTTLQELKKKMSGGGSKPASRIQT
jgi:aryl-alcohol dehydrogenase-like predicted oxidoreductase